MRSARVALYSSALAISRDASTGRRGEGSRRAVGAGRLVEGVPRVLARVVELRDRVGGLVLGVLALLGRARPDEGDLVLRLVEAHLQHLQLRRHELAAGL